MYIFVMKFKGSCAPLILGVFLLFFPFNTSFAHSPHDVIDLVELSPAYDQDRTLFMFERSRLFKSTDRGYSWKQLVNGFEKRLSATALAISPLYHQDKTLFLSSNIGVYKSVDGGLSWHLMSNELLNLEIQLLAISPDYVHEEMLLAIDHHGALYKSINGGESFYNVYNSAEIKIVSFFNGLHEKFICMGDKEGIFYVSTDNGETWKPRTQVADSGSITSIAVSPSFTSDNTIVVGTAKGGVFKSLDGGNTFQKSETGISDKHIISVAMSPNYEKDSIIFASTWYSVFGSKDRGGTWQETSKGLTTDPQADRARWKSPHFRGLRISKTFEKDLTLFVAGFDGLFKSTDGAKSWLEIETLAASGFKHLAVSPAYKEDSTIVITAFDGGVYKSGDRGDSWEVRNSGLFKTHLMGISISPNFSKDHTIFTSDNRRLYKSIDDGQNWNVISLESLKRCYWGRGLRKRISSVMRRIGLPDSVHLTRFDSSCEKPIFPREIVISSQFKIDPTIFFSTRYDGAFRSFDGGQKWSSTSSMGPGGWVTSLAISPNFLSDGTLISGVRGDGIYRTRDGGEIWRKVYDWKTLSIYIVVSPNFNIDKTIFAGSGEGLVKTTDGGATWEKVGGACCGQNASIKAVAISPNFQSDRIVMVSVEGRGLFKSDDGGSSFFEIGPELINKNHNLINLKFSPTYQSDKTIFGASYEEIFRSADGGETWVLLKRPIRYEEGSDYIRYEGKWASKEYEQFTLMKVKHSDIPTSRARFNFVGSGIRWIGGKGDAHGMAKVFIDGKLTQLVNQFSSEREFKVPVFSIDKLNEGAHSIEIEVTNTKEPQSSGYRIDIDAFDVIR